MIKRIFFPTLFMMAALAVLLSLGFWQLERKTWKDGLIRQVEARQKTPAGALPAREHWNILAQKEAEFSRLIASGRFEGTEAYLYRPLAQSVHGLAAGPGWDVVQALNVDGSYILVNRGFIPDAKSDPQSRPPLPLDATFTGIVRHSEPRSMMAASDNLEKRQIFTRDIAVFGKALGLDTAKLAPFMLDAEADPQNTDLPRAGLHTISLPNRHFEYALTWFGLALTLVGVYGAWLYGALRRRALPDSKTLV